MKFMSDSNQVGPNEKKRPNQYLFSLFFKILMKNINCEIKFDDVRLHFYVCQHPQQCCHTVYEVVISKYLRL